MGLPISVVSDKEEVSNFPYLRYLYPLGMVVPRCRMRFFRLRKILWIWRIRAVYSGRQMCGQYSGREKESFSIYVYASYENRLKNCCEYFEMEKACGERLIGDEILLFQNPVSQDKHKGYHS